MSGNDEGTPAEPGTRWLDAEQQEAWLTLIALVTRLPAERANASLSRLSHVITKMEKAGWVRRESIRGSRGSDAVLTDEGMAKVVEAAPPHVESVRSLIFDGLSAEQVRQLSELSGAMLTQLDKSIASGTGRA